MNKYFLVSIFRLSFPYHQKLTLAVFIYPKLYYFLGKIKPLACLIVWSKKFKKSKTGPSYE